MYQTIEKTVENGLCTGCGTCASVCPMEAIRMVRSNEGVYVPKLGPNCNRCGICVNVCPGYSVDFKKLSHAIFQKQPENKLLGNVVSCYVGHASDQSLRYNSSSGGLVTSLLIFALEEGVIDGALVTKMNEKNPLEPKAFIARTREQIISATGSKYCPVPANLALREIKNSEGEFAIVGLPCHIHGIRKAEERNKNLKRKIVLHLGLFCSHSVSFKGTEFLLETVSVKKEDVKGIAYRGRGWSGPMTIKSKNTGTIYIPWNTYKNQLFDLSFFTPLRCLQCTDMTCELADISFGDAWLPQFSNDQAGNSVVIVRNSMSEELLQRAVAKHKITLNKISASRILEQHANRDTMRFKKAVRARFLPFAMLRRQIPFYSTTFSRPKLNDFFVSTQLYINAYLSMNQKLWKAIPAISVLTRFAARLFHR